GLSRRSDGRGCASPQPCPHYAVPRCLWPPPVLRSQAVANVPRMPVIASRALITPNLMAYDDDIEGTQVTKISAKPAREATRQLKYVPTAQPTNKTAKTEFTITPLSHTP